MADPYRSRRLEGRAALEALANAGRARLDEADRLGPRAVSELDVRDTGLSLGEQAVRMLLSGATMALVVGFYLARATRFASVVMLLVAAPLWLAGVLLSVPVFGGAAVLLGAERRYMVRLPMVIDGYLELLERSRLVQVVRVRVRLQAPEAAAESSFLRAVLLGMGAEADVTAEGQQVEAFFTLGKVRPWRFRRWFHDLAERLLVPLDVAYGVARVDLADH